MALFVKIANTTDQPTVTAATEFDEPAFLEYELPIVDHKNVHGDMEPYCRPLIFSPTKPTRTGKDADLWFNTDPEHEGERMHELQDGEYQQLSKPTAA